MYVFVLIDRYLLIVLVLAEHHVVYQYNLHEAKDHYMALIQTETVS